MQILVLHAGHRPAFMSRARMVLEQAGQAIGILLVVSVPILYLP
jgi:hypothetical protein